MRRIFIPLLLLTMLSCTKKPSALVIHFDRSELHLDKAEIQSLPPNELRTKGVGAIVDAFKAKKVEDWSAAAKGLPQPWRALYTALELDSEVANGGFHQYFYNIRAN